MATIRRAVVADADAMAALHMRAWQIAYRGLMPDDFLDQLDVAARAERWRKNLGEPGGDTFVFENGAGRVVGFSSLLACRDDDATTSVGEIAAVYIHPEVMRIGCGTALMRAATERARERGFDELRLWVLEGNHNARRFYEALGYRADGGEKAQSYGGSPLLVGLRYRITLT